MIGRKRFICLLTVIAICIPALQLQAGQVAAGFHDDTLQGLFSEALANNQGLLALEHRIEALKEEVQAAGAWEDPRLGVGLLNLPTNTFRFDREPMTQKQVTLAQRIPWFGKLDLKTRRAALNAVRLEAVLSDKQQAIMRNLANAYYELGFVAESQAINARLIDLLDRIIRIAESRYASGKGIQQDVLQAHVEQSRLMDQSNTLKRRQRVLNDRINALANRSVSVSVTPPVLKEIPGFAFASEDLQQAATGHNTELLIHKAEIELAEVEVELFRKAYYPDPDLRLAYGQRDDDAAGNDRADFFSASVVFSLPVWAKRKQAPRLEAALKRRDAARLSYQDLAAQLPHRIDALTAELEQIDENYNLYQDAILVQAVQWAESAMSAYEVGKADFGTMMAPQMRVLYLERQAKQYLYQFYQKQADLDATIGGRLGRLQTPNTAVAQVSLPIAQRSTPKIKEEF
ncbi:MAG: TolC family protein [Desulfobacteraceae bacterium]|jgi:outer membrane protein TolC